MNDVHIDPITLQESIDNINTCLVNIEPHCLKIEVDNGVNGLESFKMMSTAMNETYVELTIDFEDNFSKVLQALGRTVETYEEMNTQIINNIKENTDSIESGNKKSTI